MNHDDARRAISELMDGERLSNRTAGALRRHLADCGSCHAFERGAWRLREVARFGVAEPVPDLVGPIMASVRAAGRPRIAPRGPRPGWSRAIASVAASIVVGLVAGSLTVGGPWRTDDRTSLASAADVSAGVAAAATKLSAYQATFAITESDPGRSPKRRQLSMSVAFRAPERFRLDITDRTPGADARFAADDLQVIVNGSSSYQAAPSPCPLAVCPQRARTVRHRLPFSSATPAPTDLILPVSTLVDAREMTVVGAGRVLGRDAVEVSLTFDRARPLFPFLALGGTWRPFFAGDRVDLWLDARSWFPLRYSVYPAAGPKRDEWQLRFGLPDEPPGVAVFDVRALSIQASPPPASTFRIPHVRAAEDEGGRDVALDDVKRAVSFDAITPPEVDGLPLYRAVVPESDRDRAVLTYSSGLSWLKLGETRASGGESFFGPVGEHAQAIDVDGVGTAYYQPASARHGRRLALHTSGGDVYLETNLPRERLLDAAAALDVEAAPVPPSWLRTSSPVATTERVPIGQAVASVPFGVLLPQTPPGFALASAEVITVGGDRSLSVYFQREDAGSDAGSLRLHEEAAGELPPASAARQFEISVRGVEGRWTPGRHQLEWVEGGVYCSLDAPAVRLSQLLRIASSMTAADGGA